jgi:hypothetical protein
VLTLKAEALSYETRPLKGSGTLVLNLFPGRNIIGRRDDADYLFRTDINIGPVGTHLGVSAIPLNRSGRQKWRPYNLRLHLVICIIAPLHIFST